MDDRNDFQKRIGVGERQYRYGRHVGTNKHIPVRNEDTGTLGGVQTEHWSGRVDATVFARRINRPRPKTSE